MKLPSYLKKSIYSGLTFFLTVLILSVWYGALNGGLSLSDKVGTWSGLTSASWNRIIDGVLDLDARISNFSFSGGNVGIGIIPSETLEIEWNINVTGGYKISCSNRIKTISARTYTTLNTQLDADPNGGASICWSGWHVCNTDEAQVYGITYGCDIGSSMAWIIGWFPNTESHRRAGWNSQDLVNCLAGNYPAWYPRYGYGYLWRVHCNPWTTSYPVACCKAL